VYYEDNQLLLKWKGSSKIKPVVLDETTFFVPDMYQKLRFETHPQTKKRYLAVVDEEDESKVTYEYIKVADDYMTPWMYVKSEDFEKATLAYLGLQEMDSTKTYIEEHHINRIGYELLRDKKYEKSIAAFQMNVTLYPDSDNVYDSLADAYLRSGDSLQAYANFKKALELNSGNPRAKAYIESYGKN
jgi:tetratricopeptide (TPR) repeat protein